MSFAETVRGGPRVRHLIEQAAAHRIPVSVRRPASVTHAPGYAASSRFRSSDRRDAIEIEPLVMAPEAEPFRAGDLVEVAFASYAVKGYCRFQSEILSLDASGARLAYPKMVERFQRRLSVRVNPPEHRPVFVELDGDGHAHRERVRSLSTRGAGFFAKPDPCFAPGQFTRNLRLIFPDGKVMPRATAKVNEVSLAPDNMVHVSIVFLDLDAEKDLAIRAYMQGLIEGDFRE